MIEPYQNREMFACPAARAETVGRLLREAGEAKKERTKRWREMRELCEPEPDGKRTKKEKELVSAVARYLADVPIKPNLPDFAFAGKEEMDEGVARMRTKLVKTVCRENNLPLLYLQNERRLGMLGSACYKLSLASNEAGEEEIVITAPPPEEIFPDPHSTSVEGCEYIAHTVRTPVGDTVTEFWFRQPCDGEADGVSRQWEHAGKRSIAFRAGDIALLVFVNGREVRYHPKYWEKTSDTHYPFVVYSRRLSDFSLWGRSEAEELIRLCMTQKESRPALFAAHGNRNGRETAMRLLSLLAFLEESTKNRTSAVGDYLRKRETVAQTFCRAGIARLYSLVDRFVMEFYDAERWTRLGADGYSARECEDCLRFFGYAPRLDLTLGE